MTKDTATKTATAFDRFDDLLGACRRGYIPTLTIGQSDDLPTRRAKKVLESALEGAGCEVFA